MKILESIYRADSTGRIRHLVAMILFTVLLPVVAPAADTTPEAYLDSLISLTNQYTHMDRDSTRYFADKIVEFAKAQDDPVLLSKAYNNYGYIYYRWNKLDSSEAYLQQAIGISQEHMDRRGEGIATNRLGNVYWFKEQPLEAKRHYERAKSLHETVGNPEGIGRALNNLANIYREWGDYQRAIQLYIEARDYYQKADYKEGVAWLDFSLTILYKNLNEYDQALESINRSVEMYKNIAESSKDSTGLMICYGQLGDIYNLMGQYEEGLKYHLRAMKMRKRTGIKTAYADGLAGVGQSYFKLGNYEKSLRYFKHAQQLREEANSLRGSETNLKYIGFIYHETGRDTKALEYLTRGLQVARELNERGTNFRTDVPHLCQ